MNLNDVMTLKEAAERWGLHYENVRQALKRGKFDEEIRKGTIRKSHGVWLVTTDAMGSVFGETKGRPRSGTLTVSHTTKRSNPKK